MGQRYAQETEIVMTLGEGTSKMCAHLYNRVVDGITKEFIRLEAGTGTGNTGISCFNEVFHHELEHIVIWGENWDKGFVDIWDKDGDLYSDEFEIKMMHKGFDPDLKQPWSDLKGPGYEYEEERCRAVQDAVDPDLLIDKDWSFDPTDKYQGKNWKK